MNGDTQRFRGGVASVKRPVFVFFSSKESLESFHNSAALQQSNLNELSKLLVLTTTLGHEEREHKIKRACASGIVCLATREFGRGTDFVCDDQDINAAGGIHVIQAFISDDISEEIQIRGRTARQGPSVL